MTHQPSHHTHLDLIASAQRALRSGDAAQWRHAALDAATSLEVYVQHAFAEVAAQQPGYGLAMLRVTDAVSQLHLCLFVLGIDAASEHLSQQVAAYQQARALRNRIVHRGQRVEHHQARTLLRTISFWMRQIALALNDTATLIALTRLLPTGDLGGPSSLPSPVNPPRQSPPTYSARQ